MVHRSDRSYYQCRLRALRIWFCVGIPVPDFNCYAGASRISNHGHSFWRSLSTAAEEYSMPDIEYWKALTCFGDEQAERILRYPQWRKLYPQVFESLDSQVDRIKYDTRIPLPMVRAMAQQKPNLYIFGIRGNLLACFRNAQSLPVDFEVLSATQALERFGPESLYQAVEYGSSQV